MKANASTLLILLWVFLIAGSLMSPVRLIGQVTLRGKVSDFKSGQPLAGAHITLENTFHAAAAGSDGLFSIENLREGTYTVKTTYVGYQPYSVVLRLSSDTLVNFSLSESPILGDEVNIVATRAGERYPTAYSTISPMEIEEVNLGKDMPFLIQSSPSVTVTSDAGNGIGYSGIYIRGTDLTRINVTINGIPVNDAESQGVWFVDLPDLASSTQNIQVQRGVGTSTNGAGAFGATINILTSETETDPYGELSASYGSYNSWKTTLKFGSGILRSGFAIDGRMSYISSEGYIDRAFSRLRSYYISGGYYGKNTTLKLVNYSGHEKTYQAWEGVPLDSLGTNRRYNPAGQYTDSSGQIQYYHNQTDNYTQNNYQLIFSQRFGRYWNLNAALHLTRGYGYYENYKQNDPFSEYGLQDVIVGGDTITATNLVNRKILDNWFYGMTISAGFTQTDQISIIVGGAANQYYGEHLGKVIWAQYSSNGDNDRNWYYNTGLKNDINVYVKGTWQMMEDLTLFADLQYRHVGYRLNGILDDLQPIGQKHRFDLFNPKAGIYYTCRDHLDAYFSFGIGNREPSRNNYVDSDSSHMPAPERLYDYELGVTFHRSQWSAGINGYFMQYKDQLVLTGEINNVGEAIMVNVPRSYRAGVEISAGVKLWNKLRWDVQGTLSMNKIKKFTGYVDHYDSAWNFTGQVATYLGTTDLSFSPGILLGSVLTYKPVRGLSISLQTKYVGKQYIDNTSSDSRSLHPYFVNNLILYYNLHLKPFSSLDFHLAVNNLFSQRYESNAWVYRYIYVDQPLEVNGYFPQALINVMAGISLKL